MRLVNDVIASNRLVALVAQQNVGPRPAQPEDLYRTGTMALIHEIPVAQDSRGGDDRGRCDPADPPRVHPRGRGARRGAGAGLGAAQICRPLRDRRAGVHRAQGRSHPRARGGHPERRSLGGRDDPRGAGLAGERAAGAQRCGDDRGDHVTRARAPGRGHQGEGAGRAPRRDKIGDLAQAQRGCSRRRARGGAGRSRDRAGGVGGRGVERRAPLARAGEAPAAAAPPVH